MITIILYIMILIANLSWINSDCSSKPDYCEIGNFCNSIFTHCLSIIAIAAIVFLQTDPRFDELFYNRCVSLICNSFYLAFTNTLLWYFFEFMQLETSELEPECIPDYDIQFSWGYFTSYGLIITMFCCLLSLLVIFDCYEQSMIRNLSAELDHILKNIYLDQEEIRNFYERNKGVLSNKPIYPQELVVYKDQFEQCFKYSAWKDQNQCAICFNEEFEDEEKVVPFPGCRHNFHYECISTWLNQKNICPICRVNFREGFVEELCVKMETSFMKDNRSNEEEQKPIN